LHEKPVAEKKMQAAEGKLVWVLSGDSFAKNKVQHFCVPAMGRKVIDVGSNVERASAYKLSAFCLPSWKSVTAIESERKCADGNMLILGIIENLAESMTLAERTGVGADLLMDFVKVLPEFLFTLAPCFALIPLARRNSYQLLLSSDVRNSSLLHTNRPC
jgi:TusA-related sulfurtransferase